MKKISILMTAAVMVLSGCQGFFDSMDKVVDEYKNTRSEVTQVGRDTYQYYINQPWQTSYLNFKETLFGFTTNYCNDRKLSAQLIDFYSNQKARGMEGTIVFRCVKKLPPPTPGLFFPNNPDIGN